MPRRWSTGSLRPVGPLTIGTSSASCGLRNEGDREQDQQQRPRANQGRPGLLARAPKSRSVSGRSRHLMKLASLLYCTVCTNHNSSKDAMYKFLDAFQEKITGVLSCFDRLVFRGHLPFGAPWAMDAFLNNRGILLKDFKPFVTRQAERLKKHAQAVAEEAGRPFVYLSSYVRKEDKARAIAEADGVHEGLVCVFSAVEPCRSFALRYGEQRPHLEAARRKCLFLYYYFMDRDFGLMHVRIQTWFPLQIQIYLNGHEWLARKMDCHGIAYRQADNAFTWVSDIERAQRFADRFANLKWPRIFGAIARRVNPLLADLLQGFEYYWVTDQAEFATDVMFENLAALQSVYPKLLQHSTLCFSAEDVLTFLGRKPHPRFAGEILNDCKHRLPGARVKHRMKDNWIKMYDKHGCVLRIETVINRPNEFRVRRKGKRKGQEVVGWYPMAKGVSNLYRYAQVSLQANRRYLDALAAVKDPACAYHLLDRVCEPATFLKRKVRGFNPVSRADVQVFEAVLRGEHAITGFRNGQLLRLLFPRALSNATSKRRASACVTRLIQRLRAHGLVAKFPRSRRYRVTTRGNILMSAAIHLREEGMPQLLAAA